MVLQYTVNTHDVGFINGRVVAEKEFQPDEVPTYARRKEWCPKCHATVLLPCVVCALNAGETDPQPLLGYKLDTRSGKMMASLFPQVVKLWRKRRTYKEIAAELKITLGKVQEIIRIHVNGQTED